jgi:hypothetical protein
MGEQISITKTKELEENELDTFIEMPIDEKTKEEEPKKTNIKEGFRYLDGYLLSKEFSLEKKLIPSTSSHATKVWDQIITNEMDVGYNPIGFDETNSFHFEIYLSIDEFTHCQLLMSTEYTS